MTETDNDTCIGRCLYCQTDCFQHEKCTVCRQCGSIYHVECWEENGGCSQFGCPMAPDVKKRNETEIPQSFWGKENKACPKCGKEILAAAVRCRYCGARFLSERPLGTSEFEFQEKIKTKKTAIKRTIIILLILNIISVSAPIAAIAASVWYSYNKKMVAALPSLYRTLIIIGITTGVVQSVLIITMASLYSFFPG